MNCFSFLECASLCAINSSCLALNFDKADSTCNLGNRTDFRIQTNQTLWNEALPVHVKEGIQLETNGKSKLKLENIRMCGSRCYVRLDVLRQFKTDLVQRLEGLVF